MIKKLLIPVAITSSLFIGTSAAQADPIVLDEFSSTASGLPNLLFNPGGPGVEVGNTEVNLSGVLGGSRQMTLTNLANGSPGPLQSNGGAIPDPNPTLGFLGWNNDTGVQSTFSVLWDGNGAGLGSVVGQSGIAIDVIDIDLTASIEFRLMDNAGNTSSLSSSGILPGSVENFAFEDFVGMSVDLGDLKSIELFLSGPQDVDAAFSLIELPMISNSTPEPATVLSLLAFGSCGLLVGRRQNKKS